MVDYSQCIFKGYPGITSSDFTLQDSGDGTEITYWNTSFGAEPTLESLEQFWLPVVKAQAILDIKEARRQGADKAVVSSGILAIYLANYEAACAYLEGKPTQICKNGMTAEAYLTRFGARLNMSAPQFATYIVNENIRIGPTIYDIEERYLALAYAGDIPNGIYPISVLPNVDAVITAVIGYIAYCDTTVHAVGLAQNGNSVANFSQQEVE